MDKFYIGTDLKFLFNITAAGFDMDRDSYEITLVCLDRKKMHPPVVQPVAPEQVVVDGDNHYLCVNSTIFGTGLLKAVVTAHVPDEDFPDGERTEILVEDLCNLNATY